MAGPPTPQKRLLARRSALINERSSWVPHWQEISQYQQPRLGRYFEGDKNRGDKRHGSIYDNTAIFASRTLAAGMMSGMTSPARPWFRLALADKDLMEYGPVKSWLHRTGGLMRDVFTHSNTYRSLHMVYEELGLFGTGASVMLPDFDSVLHHYPLTIGEYAIATDYKGRVNALARDVTMTVAQCVEQFGKANCSTAVRNLYDRGQLDARVPVVQMIEPRADRDARKRDGKNMPFASCYLELGAENDNRYLRESGFKRFPALVPRWSVTGNDVYGSSPGMEALGDVKQLQHEQLRKSQGIDYQTNPPLQVPTAYKDAAKNRLPGGVMYVDNATPGGGIRSAFEVNLNLQHLLMDIEDVRGRIKSAYYADLFLMLANDTRSGITATEVAERHEEKLLMLGPVLERLHNELLQPKIDMTFDYLADAGALPPIPQELEGVELNVEFISTLAQAQRAVAAQGMDRLLGTVGSIAAMSPSILDKIDFDQAIDDYGDMYGVNPEIIRPDDVVAQMRADRAKQQQAAQMAAAAPVMADTAKTVGDTNAQGLADVTQLFQGYSMPAGA